LPWQVHIKRGDSREVLETHPANWLLHTQSAPNMTAFAWREAMVACALTFGDCYAEIERDMANRPLWLHLLHPVNVQEARDEDGRFVYRVRNTDGTSSDVQPDDMFHIHGLGRDGMTGYNLINMATQSIGLALAMEEFGAAFFGNGASPSGVFEVEPGVSYSPEQMKEFREELGRIYVGSKNARRPLLTPKGMKWKQTSIAPEDGQFNESRQQQVEEIARWFGVPLHKIGHLLRSTNNNIEHQSIEFVTDCLVPWITRLEQEANVKLIGSAARGRVYTKINVGGLLRGDTAARYAAYASGRQWGFLSVNDIRRLEDMNPIGAEGDIYLSPANMLPADKVYEQAEKSMQPPAPPQIEEPTAQDEEQPPQNAQLLRVIAYAKEQAS
jgi:HK97 family phage portal protein